MKIVLFLIAVILGICLACRFSTRQTIAAREQLLATTTFQHFTGQFQAISMS